MEAARLLYGELELDASNALFAVDQLDSGFDLLAENILETQGRFIRVRRFFNSIERGNKYIIKFF